MNLKGLHNKLSYSRLLVLRANSLIKLVNYLPILALLVAFSYSPAVTLASTVTNYQMNMSNQLPGQLSQYNFSFTIPSSVSSQLILLQFCSNSPLYEQICVTPAGLNASGVVVSSLSNLPGFSYNSSLSNTNNVIFSSLNPTNLPSGQVNINLNNIVNTSTIGPSYARIELFPNLNVTNTPEVNGGLAYSITNSISISTYVPPYLYFCSGVAIANMNCDSINSSSDYINFGNLSSAATKTATSQLLLATNAQNGYVIQLIGNTLTSGNNVLPALSQPSQSVPGSSQFGLNLSTNSVPFVGQSVAGPGIGNVNNLYNQPNLFSFATNSILATANQPSDFVEYTISYIVNISTNQSPGQYATTLTYVASANF